MSQSKILTVGIPTYNGSKHIKKAIDSILHQLANVDPNELEILISDNASSDNTQEVIKDYLNSNCGIISYFRNENNVGFDRNVDLVVMRARGSFVWLLSDDDTIEEGGIVAVMTSIKTHSEAAVIFVNYAGEPLKTNEACLLAGGGEFFARTAFKSGLISSNVVNKQRWVSSDLRKYIGTGWIHMGYLVSCLAVGQGVIIAERYVVQGGGERRWGYNGSFIFTGLELVKIFKEMPQLGYSSGVKRKADFVIKGGYRLFIPIAKIEGLMVNYELVAKFYHAYKQYPSLWLIDIPLLLIPRSCYVFLRKLYKHGKKILLYFPWKS